MADSPQAWANALLNRLGIPPNRGNVRALVGWAQAEGGHWKNQARFNPLNTTQPEPGAGNTGSQGNIKAYKDWQQGLNATVATLRNGRYGGILQALKGNDPGAIARAIGSSPWGTNASLVAKTIGGTTGTPVRAGGRAIASAASATRTIPGIDRSRERGALIAQFLQDKNANPVDLALGVRQLQDTPSRTVTTGSSSPSSSAPAGRGSVANFGGKPVASWIAKELNWARANGWTGSVSSGYRSVAEQARIYNSGVRPAAKPGQSNHNFTAFPGGAVDVTNAQQLAQILARKPGGSLLRWAGSKDPVHFSHPHAGGY